MYNQRSGQFALRTIGSAYIIGVLVVAWSPATADPWSPPGPRLDFPSTLLELAQERDLTYTRAAARWRPGAAVTAGAALGFVTAAAATTYVASSPPAAGYCWYYTNPQRTQGFWDVCPQ